jgi:hypothetical protein
MFRRATTLTAATVSLAALLGACTGATSPSPTTGAASAAPTTASSAASSPAASGATGSGALGSGGLSSAGPSGAGGSGAPTGSGAASPAGSGGTGAATEVEWVAKDFSYDGVSSVAAGSVSITLTNEGKESHQAQIGRLASGATFEQIVAALQQPNPSAAFQLMTFVGGPTNVPPGGEGTVSAVLEPGKHIIVCFLRGADNVPHFAKGMVAQFDVTGTAAGGSLPSAGAELTLQDFAFVGLDSLPAGEQVVHVTNKGPQAHEAAVVKLTGGATVEDILKIATSSGPAPSGPPPWQDAGGVAAFAPGEDGNVTVNLQPGDYAFICSVPDPATGKPHFQLGMVGALKVQ